MLLFARAAFADAQREAQDERDGGGVMAFMMATMKTLRKIRAHQRNSLARVMRCKGEVDEAMMMLLCG